jgi:acetylornithine deacetylase/succinyl-diaminopimelate desuccinylase-like protein
MRRHPFAIVLPLLWLAVPDLPAPAANSTSVLSEAAGWLQRYVRVDTSNPPGNEQQAADFLASLLQREGIPSQAVRTPEGRANLWARLASPASGGRAVLLLHHMDVVPAGPGWSAQPFAGEVRDGFLWGRGALDDKSLGIVQLAALVDLKRRRVPIARDVIFLAVADEENGGLRGTAWLLAQHPELFQGVEAVIGEGGRSQTGAGLNPESASHQLIEGLARLLGAPPRFRVSPPVRDYARAIAPLQNPHWRRVFGNIDAVIAEGGPKEFLMPGMANLFLDTVQVTVLRGGDRINVIPETATARIDIRLLPDTDAVAFLKDVRRLLGPGFAVKVLVTSPPSPPSPASGRLYRAMERALKPEGPVVPTFIAGFTDSRYFRERGIPAYGLSPFVLGPEDTQGIHGTNERISLRELDRGVVRMRQILSFYVSTAQ